MVLQYRQCAIYLFEFTLRQHTSCDVNTIRPIYSAAIVIQMFQNGTYTLKLLWNEGDWLTLTYTISLSAVERAILYNKRSHFYFIQCYTVGIFRFVCFHWEPMCNARKVIPKRLRVQSENYLNNTLLLKLPNAMRTSDWYSSWVFRYELLPVGKHPSDLKIKIESTSLPKMRLWHYF